MSIIAKNADGKDFKQISAGTVQAVCVDIWDIGLQEKEWQGKKFKQHQVVLAFEVAETADEGPFAGNRMTISKFYTLSLSEKANLRKDLEGWRGKSFTESELEGFDLEKLIGSNCMLNIVYNKKGKAKISGISKLMAGLSPLIPETKRRVPDWVKGLRERSDLYNDNPEAEVEDDSVAF